MRLNLARVFGFLALSRLPCSSLGLANNSPAAHALHARNSTGLTDAVTWDPHSLSLLGQRTFILSAEFHPWRLPNPNLWIDVLQKIKANGFNTVSFIIDWALHYPAPDTNDGQGDFQQGTYRDVQAFIDAAKEAGLWLIVRPGPYINAETSGGGLPGWVSNIKDALRTNASDYHDAWLPYLTSAAKLIAANQITQGGPIILVQAENEFSEGATHNPYMQDIIDTHRANGVVVPITHNDQHGGENGNFSPDKPGLGDVNVYCGDSYPQGTSSWAPVQTTYFGFHEAEAPSDPLCLAEFGGGYIKGWQSAARGGTGYEIYSAENDLEGPSYENVFYKENYAQTATVMNIYMTFGGTNWGNTVEPTVFTSYDYGGGINENRIATPKMNEMRLQGLFLRVARDLLASDLIENGTAFTNNSALYTAELRNPDTGAAFYFVRHNDSTSTAVTSGQLNIETSQGAFSIPQNGSLTISGREYKILPADFVFGKSSTRMVYTTAEVMTWTTIDETDTLILYGPAGTSGETTFILPSPANASTEPTVDLSNAPSASSSFLNETLTLNYELDGFSSALVTSADNATQLRIIMMDTATAWEWNAPVIPAETTFGNYFGIGTNESVLVGGPYLVRSAAINGTTLSLKGDFNGTNAPLEIFAPAAITSVTWNGVEQNLSETSYGSLKGTLGSVEAAPLPSLGPWKVMDGIPEVDPSFDDSDFINCDQNTTNQTLTPVAGDLVLYSQQYGIYGGMLVWRGHFTASGSETAVNLTLQGGFAFGYSAWINGVFLGSSQGNATVSLTTDVWQFPNSTLNIGEDNVLTIVQDHMGLVETSTNSGKEPRGIRGYALVGGNTTFSSWKLQGNLGGAAGTPDTFRGYMNEGGLYAERIGAHLPGFPDDNWMEGSPLDGLNHSGMNFYRTTFNLSLSQDTDVPIRLSITPSDIISNFRAQIWINGWMLGKYINNFGPQTAFVLPAGILRRTHENTLAVSLWSLDGSGASISGLSLISDGTFQSSLGSALDDWTEPPDYAVQEITRPTPNYYPPS